MENETERQLIERAKKDPQAFGLLYDKYYDRILRYAMYRTGSAETGRDITSETFFKALKHIGSFRWKGFPFSSWLYRIAGNEIKMYFRKKSYEPVSFEAALEANPVLQIASKQNLEEEVMAAQEALDRIKNYGPVRDALRALPAMYQEAVTLRFFEEMAIADIASVMGKKEGTVKSLISRGIAMLRGVLQPDDRSGIVYIDKAKEREGDKHGTE